jgi:hypothetical protein
VADYYVLLNSDIEVTSQWLGPDDQPASIMIQPFAAVQPKVLSYHNKNKFEHAGAAGGLSMY